MKEFHWFVSHGMGFRCAATLEDAMEGAFCTSYFGDMGKWMRNIQKGGDAGIPAFACKVPGPIDSKYGIEWFVPQVEGLTERQNLIVTYVTKKKVVWMKDPMDKVRVLLSKIEELEDKLEEAGG